MQSGSTDEETTSSGEALRERLRARLAASNSRLRSSPPTVDTPVIDVEAVEPVIVEPVTVEPVMVGPVTVEPVTVEPVTVGPVTVEPVTVEPVMVASPPLLAPSPVLQLQAPQAPMAPTRVPTTPLFIPPAAVSTDRRHSKQAKKRSNSSRAAKSLSGGPDRHPVRRFLVIIVVLAVLGGAAYVGWTRYLRKGATWSAELRPTATLVEKTLHRSFDKTVPVVTLLPEDYDLQLTQHVLDRLYPDPTVASDLGTGAAAASGLGPGVLPTSLAMRAVGLTDNSPPDVVLHTIGPVLSAHTTAFYSDTDRTIYRLSGTTALFQVDLIRAVSAALVDQALDLDDAEATMSDAQRIGVDAVVDGIANRVVAARYAETPDLRQSMDFELKKRLAEQAPGLPTPLFLYAYLSSYEQQVTTTGADATDPGSDPLADVVVPSSDALVFDPSRSEPVVADGAQPVPAPVSTPSTRSLGMEFWFEALVPTMGVDAARLVALLWTGDTSNPSVLDDQACMDSTISTADAAGQAGLLDVMSRWASSRPETSVATAAASGDTGVMISMCSPADPQPVPEGTPDMGALFTRADAERAVLERAEILGLPETPASRSCFVAAFRSGSIAGYDPVSDDQEMIAQMTNVILFCKGA